MIFEPLLDIALVVVAAVTVDIGVVGVVVDFGASAPAVSIVDSARLGTIARTGDCVCCDDDDDDDDDDDWLCWRDGDGDKGAADTTRAGERLFETDVDG